MNSTKPLTPKQAEAVAARLRELAKLLADRPTDVMEALEQLSGSLPGYPDPLFLHPEERHSHVATIAKRLGLGPSELLLLGEALSRLAPRNDNA